jgi:hypothetical protein
MLVAVEIRAHAFERFGRPLAGARIAVFERPGLQLHTGPDGRCRSQAVVGERLTAALARRGCQPIQTATIAVPAGGLVGDERAITLQVPLALTYRILRRLLTRPRPGYHHIATTITAAGRTLADCPQGECDAEVELTRLDAGEPPDEPPIYLGAIPWIHKTDFGRPLLAALGVRAPLRRTSVDGGVLIANVPRGRYRLGARKPGVRFTAAEIEIRDDSPALINVSPPHAPRVIGRAAT